MLLSAAAANRLVALEMCRRKEKEPTRLNLLSERQSMILHWISIGKSNAEISIITGIKQRTVDYHVTEILNKLNVSSRLQASVVYMSGKAASQI